jgi:Flp pilus assembly protein TadG
MIYRACHGRLGRARPRRAVTAVEFALVCPIVLFFMIGLVVGAYGIFRYHLVSSMARESARYLAVRGNRYETVTGNPAGTAEDVYRDVIRPNAVSLDPGKLTYEVGWAPDNRQNSMVIVRVSYRWIPEAFLGGITLSSTAVMPIAY